MNGLPHIIYPGICLRDEWPADARAHYCTNFAVAVPSNPLTDVLLANWSKPADINPIVNGSSKDPSPAWRTADGAEWRFSDNTGRIYASSDFRRWRPARGVSGLPTGDCPSLQPLPRQTPGAGAAPPGSDQPTHLHTSSGNPFGTWVQAGVYQDGLQGTSGTWRGVRSAAGRCLTAHGACGRSIDRGQVYAATQFQDPVKNRTLLWSWAPVSPNSSMTLLRELTWNPELEQVEFSPIEEQVQLRGAVLESKTNVDVPASTPVDLGTWSGGAGNTSELLVRFALPEDAATFGVVVMANGPGTANTSGTYFYLQFTPAKAGNPRTAVVGAHDGGARMGGGGGGGGGSGIPLARVMPGIDLPHDDLKVTPVTYSHCTGLDALSTRTPHRQHRLRCPRHLP